MKEGLGVLREEHRRILEVFDRFEQSCAAPNEPSPEYVDEILAFIQIYIDANHHGKEERALFRATEAHPWLNGFALLFTEQHEEGRGLVRAVARARERGQSGLAELRSFVEYLREHIARENEALFVTMEQALDENSSRDLAERFAEIEREVIRRWRIAEPDEEHRPIGDLRRWGSLLARS
uniref:Putative Hemerythrin HHE cation binding domain protein n=1 Tax=mine drainage metagenome TaxID=410659 RepID=E6PCH5_9ZZZZ